MRKIILLIILLTFLIVGCQSTGEDSITENISKLEDENPFTRQQAVAALGSTLDESVIKPIALRLIDEEQKVVDQVYNELNRLYTVDKPVVKEMLNLFKETENEWKNAAISYFIETKEISLNEIVLDNYELMSENIKIYNTLLVLAEQNENILSTLWEKEKEERISDLILYYDSLGYTPSIEKYENLFSSSDGEDTIKEEEMNLALRLLIRDSYEVEYSEDEKIFVEYGDKTVEVINDFTPSNERCENADKYYYNLSEDLNTITQVLLIKDDQPRYEQFFNDIVDTGYEESNFLIEDLEYLERDNLEIVSGYLAEKEELSKNVQEELGIDELMASAFIEHSPSEDLLDYKKILVVYSNGEFYDKLHWQLDKEYRPSHKEEIRYIFSIPKTSGLLSVSDRYYNDVVLQREIGDETDLYELLQEAIDKIEE